MKFAPIRVFLADDHGIVRLGLRKLIEQAPDLSVVGEAKDGRQVLLADGKEGWDVLVLDVSLPRVGGIEVLRRLHAEHPRLRIVVLSMYAEDQYANRLLAEGAAAYVSKDRPPEDLLDVIRAVHVGRSRVSRDVGTRPRVGGVEAPHTRLSPREYQVFTLLFQGRTVSDIAAEIDLHVSTVSNHMSHIKEKLGVRSIGEIVSYAYRANLVGEHGGE